MGAGMTLCHLNLNYLQCGNDFVGRAANSSLVNELKEKKLPETRLIDKQHCTFPYYQGQDSTAYKR